MELCIISTSSPLFFTQQQNDTNISPAVINKYHLYTQDVGFGQNIFKMDSLNNQLPNIGMMKNFVNEIAGVSQVITLILIFILVSELTHSLSWLNTSIGASSYDKVVNTSDKAMQHPAAIPTVSAHSTFTHFCQRAG